MGEMIYNPIEIKDAFLKGFREFFCANLGNTPFNLSTLGWDSVTLEEETNLTRQFNKEEIWCALQ